MAIDKLQEKIRKQKNPSMVVFSACAEQIPPCILTKEGTFYKAYLRFCRELLHGLKGSVPAVRFGFASFALLGAEGLNLLSDCLAEAKRQGYYVLLDGVESFSAQAAEHAANVMLAPESVWPCDGLVVSAYAGSDVLKPYVKRLRESRRDLFVMVRSRNKSASELQDLLTGGRLVHIAAADIVNRLGEPLIERCGYSCVGAAAGASAPYCLKALRSQYASLFLIVEGYEHSNAKNCSFAFDQFGHGAIVCASDSVTAAWRGEETDGADFVEKAMEASERMKKNLLRYITVL